MEERKAGQLEMDSKEQTDRLTASSIEVAMTTRE